MGCTGANESFNDANDICDLVNMWNTNEQYFLSILTSSNSYLFLKKDIAQLHYDINDTLFKIQVKDNKIEFNTIKDKLTKYQDSLNTQNKEVIDESLNELKEVVNHSEKGEQRMKLEK